MKFYIVTPTFNSWSWLQACIRSVADQPKENLHVHHHVQDGGSSDGTPEYLEAWQQASAEIEGYTFTYESAPDDGMYDAINRAWARLPDDADFTAHLNSDEQYLPHTLAQITPYFAKHPKADILLGSYIILDNELGYIAHRRPSTPALWSSWLNCTCITNSSFYRASSFRARKMAYSPRWKVVGDLVFFRDLVKEGVRFKTIPVMTSTFVCTGANLAWSDRSKQEWHVIMQESPKKYKRMKNYPYKWVNCTRIVADLLLPKPKSYELYVAEDKERTSIKILKPTCRWGLRLKANPDAFSR